MFCSVLRAISFAVGDPEGSGMEKIADPPTNSKKYVGGGSLEKTIICMGAQDIFHSALNLRISNGIVALILIFHIILLCIYMIDRGALPLGGVPHAKAARVLLLPHLQGKVAAVLS